jgi:hypothetical protein
LQTFQVRFQHLNLLLPNRLGLLELVNPSIQVSGATGKQEEAKENTGHHRSAPQKETTRTLTALAKSTRQQSMSIGLFLYFFTN